MFSGKDARQSQEAPEFRGEFPRDASKLSSREIVSTRELEVCGVVSGANYLEGCQKIVLKEKGEKNESYSHKKYSLTRYIRVKLESQNSSPRGTGTC